MMKLILNWGYRWYLLTLVFEVEENLMPKPVCFFIDFLG